MKKLCIILLALVMLFTAGCSKQAQQEPEVSAPEKTKRIVVSCIGDSITYGAGVLENPVRNGSKDPLAALERSEAGGRRQSGRACYA